LEEPINSVSITNSWYYGQTAKRSVHRVLYASTDSNKNGKINKLIDYTVFIPRERPSFFTITIILTTI